MSEHAPLPPSGASAWVVCHQWPAMNTLYGGGDTEATVEGTAAHLVLADLIANKLPGDEVLVGDTPVEVTDEMLDGAELFIADVRSAVGAEWVDTRVADPVERPKRARYLYVESRCLPKLHDKNWGTPDAWLRTADGRVVLWDYKFGHKRVDAEGNWQALNYLASIMDGKPGPCEVRIVQPRNYEPGGPVRVWRPTEQDLLDGWAQLKAAAHMCMLKDRNATVGEQCEHCPGRHACIPLQEAAMSLIDMASHPAAVSELADYQAGKELVWVTQAAALLEARRSGLEAQVIAAYRRGDRSTGWVVQRSAGRRVWEANEDVVKGLGMMFGVEVMKPPKLVTPNQAIKAGLPESTVMPLTKQQAGSEKLVQETKSTARRAFFKE